MITLHQLGLSTAIACSFAAGIAAQTSSTPPATTPPDQMTAITVTGCVQRNATLIEATTREAVGTTGARPRAVFVLADARGSAASIATPDAAVVTSTVTAYRLSGDDEEVEQNLGRRVEIMGTVDQKDGAVDRASHGETGAAALPKLTITTLKETAGTCSK
jgi:hypothetical protein